VAHKRRKIDKKLGQFKLSFHRFIDCGFDRKVKWGGDLLDNDELAHFAILVYIKAFQLF
jgi:hypothetical protein